MLLIEPFEPSNVDRSLPREQKELCYLYHYVRSTLYMAVIYWHLYTWLDARYGPQARMRAAEVEAFRGKGYAPAQVDAVLEAMK
jgi:hypothetical protein